MNKIFEKQNQFFFILIIILLSTFSFLRVEAGYTKKIDFTQLNGSNPYDSLVEYNGKFYGMTRTGGSSDYGVIFEWDPSTNTYTNKYDFDSFNGGNPEGSLVLRDGRFYGMTSYGGSENLGVIFEWNPGTNSYTSLYEFNNGTDGVRPFGSMVLDTNNDLFYGMTSEGGDGSGGVIFKFNPINNSYQKIYDFIQTRGFFPHGSLVVDPNGNLYGMTSEGSGGDGGNIFMWDINNNKYYSLYDFGTDDTPYDSLILEGDKLYGMTSLGGDYSLGTIFQFDINLNEYTKLYNFDSTNGASPLGSLIINNNSLYGMTKTGGANDYGVIFVFNLNTNIQTKLYDFDYANGYNPFGSLILKDGKFYGMTTMGGENNLGVIFEYERENHMPTASNVYMVGNPWNAGRVLTGVYTYSDEDGDLEGDSIFKWFRDDVEIEGANSITYTTTEDDIGKTLKFEVTPVSYDNISQGDSVLSDGLLIKSSPYVKKYDFNQSDGSIPGYASLSFYDGKFYGVTVNGGANSSGVIFEWDPDTNVYTKKYDFDDDSGIYPWNSLYLYNNKFYGLTSGKGINNQGTIFEWDPNTNVYTKKYDFDGTNGGHSFSSLSWYNGKFYSVTNTGGTNNKGTIFEWDPNTNVYTKKYDFDQTTGTYPMGSLTLKGGKFYGTATQGGSNNQGTIFEWDPDTNIYTKKYDLIGTGGFVSRSSLYIFNNKFYGVTTSGGLYSYGTIFEWDPETNIYNKLYDFSYAEGSSPNSFPVFYNGKFYGTAINGGIDGRGVIFEWDPDTNVYNKLYDFDKNYVDSMYGDSPLNVLALYNNKLYGTTSAGGLNNKGVIFEYELSPPQPTPIRPRIKSSGSSFEVINEFKKEQEARLQEVSSVSLINTERVLKLQTPRMIGEDVRKIQEFLNLRGYDCGIADGIFGKSKTWPAVVLFQKNNGLNPDGVVGPKTWAVINNIR